MNQREYESSIHALHIAYTNQRANDIRQFLASVTESEQLAILESDDITGSITDALAYSEHRSVLRAILDRASSGGDIIALITIAERHGDNVPSDEARELARNLLTVDMDLSIENLDWAINAN